MNPNQLKQLEKLSKVFNTSNIISPEDIQEVLKGIALLLADYRKGTVELTEDVKKTFEDVINTISDEHDKVLKEVKNTSETAKSEATEAITKAISEMKRMCAEVMEMKPKDGEKGEDADEEKIIEEVLAKIKLPEYKEVVLDDGAEIISKINDEKVAKINASQIEGLPTFEGKPNGGGWRNLNQLHDVNLSNLANNDVLKYNSTTELWENGVGGGGATAFTDLTDVPSSYSGQAGKAVRVNVGETGLEFFTASGTGTVTSVAATVPTGLTISGSPVTTSGTLAIGLDTGYVIPLQTTLDGKASTGAVTGTGITMSTARILGRTTAATGAIEELTAGSSLSLSAGSLDTIQDIRTTANPQFATIELGAATDTTLSRVSAGVIAVEGVTVPTISSTNTLTNKRVTKRTSTTNAPGATPTTNTDNVDLQIFTGLNAAITSMTTNLSGTPSTGDLLRFWLTDDGTARAITWGASFAASGTVTLPTTTVISTTLTVGFEWTGSVWRCIAKA